MEEGGARVWKGLDDAPSDPSGKRLVPFFLARCRRQRSDSIGEANDPCPAVGQESRTRRGPNAC